MRIIRVNRVKDYTTAAQNLHKRKSFSLEVDDQEGNFKGLVTFRAGVRLSGQTNSKEIPQAVVCMSDKYLLVIVSFSHPGGYKALLAWETADMNVRFSLTANRLTFFKRLSNLLQ